MARTSALVQISALLVLTGLALFFALGHILYERKEYEMLAVVVVGTNVVILFGGLQCWLVPLRSKQVRDYERQERLARRQMRKRGYERQPSVGGLDKDDGVTAAAAVGAGAAADLEDDWGSDDDGFLYSLSGGEDGVGDKPHEHHRSSVAVGWQVCGLVSLAVFAFISLTLLYLIFFNLHVNAPFRVSFEALSEHSENVHKGQLPNGLRYSIAHSDFKRDKLSILVRVDVGSFEDPDGQLGLAHVAEHVALGGSSLFPGRQAIRTQFEALGTTVHAHTSHRSTVYSVQNIPTSRDDLNLALRLFKEMMVKQSPSPEEIEKERGVMFSEERILNSTRALLRRAVFCNHFGVNSRMCHRFPYGEDHNVKDITADQVNQFFAQWYHPNRIELFIAGDFDIWEVEAAIKQTWSDASRSQPVQPSAHSRFVEPSPSHPFLIKPIKGVEGMDVNLLVSTKYNGAVHTANYHRTVMLNNIFYGLLMTQYLGRMVDADSTVSDVSENIDFVAEVVDVYQFDQTIHSLHLQVSGHPEKGSWRRYLEVFFIELRRLAEYGPPEEELLEMIRTAKMVLEAKRAYSMYEDSSQLTEEMPGNHDPRYTYLDLSQLYHINEPFLNQGFLRSASLHVQTEAQFLWKSLLEVSNNGLRFNKPPYDGLIRSVASLTIFTDVLENPQPGQSSFISAKAIQAVVNKVLNAVMVRHRSTNVQVAKLEDVFINSERTSRFWDPTRDRTDTGEADEDTTRVVREHVGEARGEEEEAELMMDGLPSSGSLVDESRLVYQVIPPKANADRISPPPDPTLSPEDIKRRSREYELIEAFPATGVKRYRLSNGLHVNLKPRLSGRDGLPCDSPGVVELEVVSVGGRSTQPPELKGACELVELNVPSGFIVEYWSPDTNSPEPVEEQYFDAKDVEQYMQNTGMPRMHCSREHFTIRKRLHSKCINYPKVRNCIKQRSHYLKKLEAVRLAMSPVFDANSIDLASRQLERLLARAERKADPAEYMKWRTFYDLQRPWMESKQPESGDHVTDARMSIVTPHDVENLSPAKVGLWVREQFTVDRMEVNVAGDFDEHHLLHQLNKMLGTMVLSRDRDREKSVAHAQSPRSASRVGYDVYNAQHEEHFALALDQDSETPAENDPVATITNCTMVSLHPGRANMGMHVLLNADAGSVRGHLKSVLSAAVFQQTLLNRLRRDDGYLYRIEAQSFHSHVFKRFGYFQLQWVAGIGDLPATTDEDLAKAREQIVLTRQAINSVLTSSETLNKPPFDAQTFATTKAHLISKQKGVLQESSAWLAVLRGLSLKPPIWLRRNDVFSTLCDISQTDVLGGLEGLQLAEVTDFFEHYLSKSKPVHVGAIETIASATSKSALNGAACDWHWKVKQE